MDIHKTWVYLGKDKKYVIGTMTAAHTTVTGLTSMITDIGDKLYIDNFFFSWLFDDLQS
jgi:hypothetical protein